MGFTFLDFTYAGTLRLDHNRLSGAIPHEIGRLVMGASCALGSLYLDHNELSGPIPYSIADIASLGTLALNDNRLTGPIPTRFEVGDYDLRWNELHASDAGLRAFLHAKQEGGDWEGTQTVAPLGLVAERGPGPGFMTTISGLPGAARDSGSSS